MARDHEDIVGQLLERGTLGNPTDLLRVDRPWVTGVMPQHERRREPPDESVDRDTLLERFDQLRASCDRASEEYGTRIESALDGTLRDYGLQVELQPTILVGISSDRPRARLAPGHNVWFTTTEGRKALTRELDRLVALERRAIASLERDLEHTPESLENVAAGHVVFGETLGAPECCRGAYTRRKRRLQTVMLGDDRPADSSFGTDPAVSPEEAATVADFECGNWHRVLEHLQGERSLDSPLEDPLYAKFASAFYPCEGACASAIERGQDVEAHLETDRAIRLFRASLIGNVFQGLDSAAKRYRDTGTVTGLEPDSDPVTFFDENRFRILQQVPEEPRERLRYIAGTA